MQKKRKIAVAASLGLLALLGATIPTSILLTKKNSKEEPKPPVVENSYAISGNIKYAALGDSIAAGFNVKLGFDQGGYYDSENNEVQGMSYSSFIANAIRETNPNRLESFYNFGLSGTTITDWLYLLDPQSASENEKQKATSNLKFDLNIDSDSNNPITIQGQKRLQYLFNNFEQANNEFGILQQQIKNANLMTISLGANDFINQVDLFSILSTLSFDETNNSELIKKYYDDFISQAQQTSQNIIENYTKLITKLKAINPDLRINLISYPMPFLRLSPLIDKKFSLLTTDLTEKALDILNGAIKQTAANTNVQYINTFDKIYWLKNANLLSSNIFDIHPDIAGYKKMAQDIFLKMSLTQDEENGQIVADKNYLDSDANSFKQSLKFAKSNIELKRIVLKLSASGVQNTDSIDVRYDFEQTVYNKAIYNFLLKNPVVDYGKLIKFWTSDSALLFEKENFESLLKRMFKNIGVDYDQMPNIKAFFAKLIADNKQSSFMPKLIDAFVESKYIDKLFANLQADLDKLISEKQIENISVNEIQNVFEKNIFNLPLIFATLKSIYKSDVVKNEEDKNYFKSLQNAIVKDLLTSKIVLELIDKDHKDVVNAILNDEKINNSISSAASAVLDDFIDNYDFYFASSYSMTDLLSKVYEHHGAEIRKVIATLIDFLANNSSFEKYVSNVVINQLENTFATKYSDEQKANIAHFAVQSLKVIPSKPYLDGMLDLIISNFIKSIENNNFNFKNFMLQSIYGAILKPYKGNENAEVILDFINQIGNDEKYAAGLKDILESFVNSNLITDISFTDLGQSQISVEEIKKLAVILINNEQLVTNENLKQILKDIFKLLVESNVLRSDLIPQFLSAYAQGNLVNKVYAFLDKNNLVNGLNLRYLNQGGLREAINEWVSALLNDIFSSSKFSDALVEIFNNFIDNVAKFKGATFEEILANLVKNIDLLKPEKVLSALAEVINQDSQSKQKGLDLFYNALEVYFDIELSGQQKTLLQQNIAAVLQNLPNTVLFKELIQKVTQTEIQNKTPADFFEELAKNINSIFKVNTIELINKFFGVIFAKDNNNNDFVNVKLDKWLLALQPIVQSPKFYNVVFDNLKLKDKLISLIKNIDLSSLQLEDSLRQQLQNIMNRLGYVVEEKFDTLVKEALEQIFASLFNEESIKRAQASPHNWYKDYATVKITEAIDKLLNNVLSTLLNDSENTQSIASSVADFIVNYLKQHIQATQSDFDTIKKLLEKVFAELTQKDFVRSTAKSIFDKLLNSINLSDDLVVSLQNTNLSNLLNVKSVINTILIDNIDKLLDLLTDKEINTIVRVLDNNFDTVAKLLVPKENKNSETNAEVNSGITDNVEVNIQINGETIFKVIKAFNKKLTASQYSQDTRNHLDSLVDKLSNNDSIKDFFVQKIASLLTIDEQKSQEIWNLLAQDSQTKTILKDALSQTLTANNSEVNKANNFANLITIFVNKNREELSSYIDSLVQKINNVWVIRDFVIDKITDLMKKELKIDSLNKEVTTDIKEILSQVISKANTLDVYQSLKNQVLDNFNKLDQKDINDLNSITWANLFEGLTVETLLNKHDINLLVNALFTNENVARLTRIWLAIKKPVLDLVLSEKTNEQSQNQEASDEKQQQSSQNTDPYIGIIKKIINSVNFENEQIKTNLTSFITFAIKDFVENNLFDIKQIKDALTEDQITLIKQLSINFVSDPDFNELVSSFVTSVIASNRYENVTSTKDFVNQLVKDNVDKVINLVKKSLSQSLTTEQNQQAWIDLVNELIIKELKLNDEQQATWKQYFEQVAKRLLSVIPSTELYNNAFAKISEILTKNDLLTSLTEINQELVKLIKQQLLNVDFVFDSTSKPDVDKILNALFVSTDTEDQDVESIYQLLVIVIDSLNTKNKEASSEDKQENVQRDTNVTSLDWKSLVVKIAKLANNSVNHNGEIIAHKLVKLGLKLADNKIKNQINKLDLSEDIKQLINDFEKQALENKQIISLLEKTIYNVISSPDYQGIETFDALVNKAFELNKNDFISAISSVAKDFISQPDNKAKLAKIIASTINEKLNNLASKQEKNALQNLVQKLLEFVSLQDIIDTISKRVQTVLENQNNLMADGKLNTDVFQSVINGLLNEEFLTSVFNTENVQSLLQKVLGTEENDTELDDLVNIYHYVLKVVKDQNKSSQTSDQNTQTDSQQTTGKNTISIPEINWAKVIIKAFSNSLPDSFDKKDVLVNKLVTLLTKVAADYLDNDLTKLDFYTSLTQEQKDLLQKVKAKVLNSSNLQNTLKTVLSDYLSTDKYQNEETVADIVNDFVKNNSQVVLDYVKNEISSLLGDNEIAQPLNDVLLHLIEKKLEIKEEDKATFEQNAAPLVSRLIAKLSSSDLYAKVFEKSKEIFDAKDLLTPELAINQEFVEAFKKLFGSINFVFDNASKGDVKVLANIIFDVNDKEDNDVKQLAKLYKILYPEIVKLINKSQQNEGSQGSEDSQDKQTLDWKDWVVKTVKMLNNSVDENADIISKKVVLLGLNIASEQLNDLVDKSQNLTQEQKDLIKQVIENSFANTKFNEFLTSAIQQLISQNDYDDLTTFDAIVNKAFALNKEQLAPMLENLISDLMQNENLKTNLAKIIVDLINTNLNNLASEQDKQAMINVVQKLLDFANQNSVLNPIIEKATQVLNANETIISDGTWNKQIVQDVVNALVDKDFINSLLTDKNIQALAEKILGTGQGKDELNDLVQVYRYALKVVKDKANNPQEANTDSQPENTNETDSNQFKIELPQIDWSLLVLQAFHNSMPNDYANQEVIINNLLDLAKLISQDYLDNEFKETATFKNLTTEQQNLFNVLETKLLVSENVDNGLKSVLKDYLASDKYKTKTSVADFVNSLVKANVQTVTTSLKSEITNRLSDNDVKESIIQVVLKLVEKELKIETEKISDFELNATPLLSRLLAKVSTTTLFQKAFEKFASITEANDLLTASLELNNTLVEELKKEFLTFDFVVKNTAKQDINVVANTIFDSADAQNHDVEQLFKLYEIVYPNLKELLTSKQQESKSTDAEISQPVDGNSQASQGQTQEQLTWKDYVVKVVKLLSNSVSDNSEQISQKVVLLALKIANKHLVEFLDNENNNTLSQAQKSLIASLKDVAIENPKLNQTLANAVANLIASENYEQLEDFDAIVNKAYNLNKEAIIDSLSSVIAQSLASEDIKQKLSQVITEAINTSFDKQANEQDLQALTNLANRLIDFISEQQIYDLVLNKAKSFLATKDSIITNSAWNTNLVQEFVNDVINEEYLKTILSAQNIQKLLEKVLGLTANEQELDDLVQVYDYAFKVIKYKNENSSQEANTESQETVDNKFHLSVPSLNWSLVIAKALHGSLPEEYENNAIIISKISKLINKIANEFVNKQLKDLPEYANLSQNQKDLIEQLRQKVLNQDDLISLVKDLIKDFASTHKYEEKQSIEEFANAVIRANAQRVITYLKEKVASLLQDDVVNNLVAKSLADVAQKVTKHDFVEDQRESFERLAQRILKTVASVPAYNVIFNKISTVLSENDIFALNWKVKDEFIRAINNIFSSSQAISELLDQPSLKAVINAIFDTENDIDQAQDDILNVYKWARTIDNKQSSSNNTQEHSNTDKNTDSENQDTELDTENSQKIDLASLATNIIKTLNGVIEQDNVKLKSAVANVMYNIAKFEISNLDLKDTLKDYSSQETNIKNLLLAILENQKPTDLESMNTSLLTSLIFKFLDKSYDLTPAQNANEVIKTFIKLAKGDVVVGIENFINSVLSDENIKSSLKEILIEVLAKYVGVEQLTDDQKQATRNVLESLFTFIKGTDVYTTALTKILDKLQDVDFIKDSQFNKAGIVSAVKEVFKDLDLSEYVTEKNTKLLINSMINSEHSAKDLMTVYKLIRSKSLEAIKQITDSNGTDSSETSNPESSLESDSQSEEQAKQKSNKIMNAILVVLKSLNGSTNEQISRWSSDFVSQFIRYELGIETDKNLVKINSDFISDPTVQHILSTAVNNEEVDALLQGIVQKYLSNKLDEYQNAEDLNNFVKQFISLNIEDLKNILIKGLDAAFSKESNTQEFSLDLFNYINNKYKIGLTVGNENVIQFRYYIEALLSKLAKQNFAKRLISDAMEQLKDLDILDGMVLDSKIFDKLLVKIITNIDWNAIITSELPEYVINTMIPDESIDFADSKQQDEAVSTQTDKLANFLDFIMQIVKKITEQEAKASEGATSDTQDVPSTEQDPELEQKKREKLEGIVLNLLRVFNNSIPNPNNETIPRLKAQIISDAFIRLARNAISNINIAYLLGITDEEQEKEVNKLVKDISTYDSISRFVRQLLSDFFTSDLKTWKEYTSGDEQSLQKVLSLLIKHEQTPVKTFIKDTLLTFIGKEENRRIFSKAVFKVMKLDNTTDDDITTFSTFIQRVLPQIINTNWFENKILNRSFWWLQKEALNFNIFKPTEFITSAMNKVISRIPIDDITILNSLMGRTDNWPIGPTMMVKLINLFIGKSNFEDSPLYNGLRNLNMDPDPSKRTSKKDIDKITGSSFFEVIGKLTAKSGTANVPEGENKDYWVPSPGDIVSFLSKTYELLAVAWTNAKVPDNYKDFKKRRQYEEYKAVYRIFTLVNYAVFNMYYRETYVDDREKGVIGMFTSDIAIFWALQEDYASSFSLNKFLGAYFKGNKDTALKYRWIRDELNQYYISDKIWSWSDFKYVYKYADENNYSPDSIFHILMTSGFKAGDPKATSLYINFDAYGDGRPHITKKEYVLKTIKDGGWAISMNNSGKVSINGFSGMNQIEKGQY
ncbi:SGNH/GDSL hydrolase family protein [Mycoplasma sp. 3341]|uniref:SGNH/GDSL hydrolase family protein n=1 Tax=Mycoplasma sp. 3341 TaxID=3447506 RepID=UPI003F658818